MYIYTYILVYFKSNLLSKRASMAMVKQWLNESQFSLGQLTKPVEQEGLNGYGETVRENTQRQDAWVRAVVV